MVADQSSLNYASISIKLIVIMLWIKPRIYLHNQEPDWGKTDKLRFHCGYYFRTIQLN